MTSSQSLLQSLLATKFRSLANALFIDQKSTCPSGKSTKRSPYEYHTSHIPKHLSISAKTVAEAGSHCCFEVESPCCKNCRRLIHRMGKAPQLQQYLGFTRFAWFRWDSAWASFYHFWWRTSKGIENPNSKSMKTTSKLLHVLTCSDIKIYVYKWCAAAHSSSIIKQPGVLPDPCRG